MFLSFLWIYGKKHKTEDEKTAIQSKLMLNSICLGRQKRIINEFVAWTLASV